MPAPALGLSYPSYALIEYSAAGSEPTSPSPPIVRAALKPPTILLVASLPSSANIFRDLREIIRDQKLDVELHCDVKWVFMRKPGFRLTEFGDVRTRGRRLGKWILQCPGEELVSRARQLLTLVHRQQVKLAKVTNIGRQAEPAGLVAVYCLDRDPEVLAALQALGWNPRWKYNYETFAEN